jgi:hypothetical protein
MKTENSAEPTVPTEEPASVERREFLWSLGKWSAAAIAAVVGGVSLTSTPDAEAGGWINGRGGWINRRGYGGGAWVNGAGGWVNRAGGWINGAGGWVNRRYYGGGGAWVNRY